MTITGCGLTCSVDVSVIKFLDLVNWGVQTHCGYHHLMGCTPEQTKKEKAG